jgi:hypothetical protein
MSDENSEQEVSGNTKSETEPESLTPDDRQLWLLRVGQILDSDKKENSK